MGVASAAASLIEQSNAVMSVEAQRVSIGPSETDGENDEQKLPVPLFPSQTAKANEEQVSRECRPSESQAKNSHQPQMHFDPVHAGILAGISNVVFFCLMQLWLTEKMARLSIVTETKADST